MSPSWANWRNVLLFLRWIVIYIWIDVESCWRCLFSDCARARHPVPGDVRQSQHQHRARLPRAGRRDPGQGARPRQRGNSRPVPTGETDSPRGRQVLLERAGQPTSPPAPGRGRLVCDAGDAGAPSGRRRYWRCRRVSPGGRARRERLSAWWQRSSAIAACGRRVPAVGLAIGRGRARSHTRASQEWASVETDREHLAHESRATAAAGAGRRRLSVFALWWFARPASARGRPRSALVAVCALAWRAARRVNCLAGEPVAVWMCGCLTAQRLPPRPLSWSAAPLPSPAPVPPGRAHTARPRPLCTFNRDWY